MAWLIAACAAAALWCWWPAGGLGRLTPRRARAGWADRVSAWVTGARGAWAGRDASTREARLRASVPQVCELLAVCLDAGSPPRGALRATIEVLEGPAADELGRVLQRIELGLDEAGAWAELASVPGYRAVGRDLARSVRSGLGLAPLLRRHAVDARKELAAEALVRARGAGVRSVVPLMLCFLPAFLLLGVVPLFGSLAERLMP